MVNNMEYTTQTFKHKNAIIRVHSPILTQEERKKREEAIKLALVDFMKEVMKNDSTSKLK